MGALIMSPMTISWIVFGCVFAGALLGMLLRATLPAQHQSADARDVLKLLAGLIGTMSALVIGLLIATAATSYATRRSELAQMAVNIVLLDRGLAHYGPETREAREQLRHSVTMELESTWPKDRATTPASFDPAATGTAEVVFDEIQQLEPHNDVQRSLKGQLITIAVNLGQTRWLLYEQGGSSIPIPFLVVLVLWLSLIFTSFGFFAPTNATMVVALLLGALSVAAGILMILELDRPFGGLIQLSGAPLRIALAHLGH
jgi:hypothetical protein